MRATRIAPTGVERTFAEDEIIVTKTDPRGLLTYANPVFLRVSALAEEEAIGQPHSIIRHPDMPSAIFKLLWETISSGQELFAYVVNLASDGAHYWVFAHVTPSLDARERLVGYHSSRRRPGTGRGRRGHRPLRQAADRGTQAHRHPGSARRLLGDAPTDPRGTGPDL